MEKTTKSQPLDTALEETPAPKANPDVSPDIKISAWDPKNPMVQFITKALGDHTSTLHERLKPGMPVTVEGPYGCFTFDDTPPRQIWVGGGIGITPFIARL